MLVGVLASVYFIYIRESGAWRIVSAKAHTSASSPWLVTSGCRCPGVQSSHLRTAEEGGSRRERVQKRDLGHLHTRFKIPGKEEGNWVFIGRSSKLCWWKKGHKNHKKLGEFNKWICDHGNRVPIISKVIRWNLQTINWQDLATWLHPFNITISYSLSSPVIVDTIDKMP